MCKSLFIAALLATANTGNNLNAHTQEMVEPSPVHPQRVEKDVTVKNNEDKFYWLTGSDFQELFLSEKT